MWQLLIAWWCMRASCTKQGKSSCILLSRCAGSLGEACIFFGPNYQETISWQILPACCHISAWKWRTTQLGGVEPEWGSRLHGQVRPVPVLRFVRIFYDPSNPLPPPSSQPMHLFVLPRKAVMNWTVYEGRNILVGWIYRESMLNTPWSGSNMVQVHCPKHVAKLELCKTWISCVPIDFNLKQHEAWRS